MALEAVSHLQMALRGGNSFKMIKKLSNDFFKIKKMNEWKIAPIDGVDGDNEGLLIHFLFGGSSAEHRRRCQQFGCHRAGTQRRDVDVQRHRISAINRQMAT